MRTRALVLASIVPLSLVLAASTASGQNYTRRCYDGYTSRSYACSYDLETARIARQEAARVRAEARAFASRARSEAVRVAAAARADARRWEQRSLTWERTMERERVMERQRIRAAELRERIRERMESRNYDRRYRYRIY